MVKILLNLAEFGNDTHTVKILVFTDHNFVTGLETFLWVLPFLRFLKFCNKSFWYCFI